MFFWRNPDENSGGEGTRPAENPAGDKPEEKVVYRWNYETQQEEDLKKQKKRNGRGARVFAVTMTLAFALAMGALVLTMIYGNKPPIIVSEDDSAAEAAAEIASPSIVTVCVTTPDGSSTGSGIILNTDGYIATNNHVVANATAIVVYLNDDRAFDAQVIGTSPIDDLAVIRITATGLTAARIGDSSKLKAAQTVIAIGSPAGFDYRGSVSKGCISCSRREILIYAADGYTLEKKMYLIQTDTTVNPGNSGGALVNMSGEVVGVVSLKLASTKYENMGFAIPINGAMDILNAIIQTGSAESVTSDVSARRPLLGVVGGGVVGDHSYVQGDGKNEEVENGTAGAFYAGVTGVWITSVSEGADAQNYLRVNDIIVQADGVAVTNVGELMRVINSHNGGETIGITYYRDGKTKTVNIILGQAS